MSLADKKLINIFKTFIQKVFVPQLPKMDINCRMEWNKFANLISSQQVVVNEMQFYVDSLSLNNVTGINNSNNTHNFNTFNNIINKHSVDRNENKSPFMPKSRRDSDAGGFNVLRTIGGEKNRIIFDPKDYEQAPQLGDRTVSNVSKDFSKDKDQSSGLTTQLMLPTLERLFKVFKDNQNKLQKPTSFTMYEAKSYA